MGRLGISVYPEHTTAEEDFRYIKKAAECGFLRVFTCLISAEGDLEEITTRYKKTNEYAQSLGMEVVLDIAPSVFQKFGIDHNNLKPFYDMGANGIRLDEDLPANEEAEMTYNPYGLKVELNASQGTKHIDYILSYAANKDRLISCHNFYPQKYTALSLSHFHLCNEIMKAQNIPIAAFVTSQNTNTFGPWPVNEGLCTLEMHRDLPIDVQARHLLAMGEVDDIIIGNAFATDAELEALSQLTDGKLTLKIVPEQENLPVEDEIIYKFSHHVRGDMGDYMARSTFSRITYANADIPPKNTRDVKRGDVVVLNNEYGRYKGELHIVLQDMKNDGNKNVVGKIPENEHMLLSYLAPWRPFKLI
ncbi:MAG: MupG family TIM beta-alpha barrel fold protein [Bacillota bacterium]